LDAMAKILKEIKMLKKELRAPAKRLYTVDETAIFLGLSPKTIRNGLGPKARKPFPVKPVRVAGRVLFRVEDLDTFIDSLEPEDVNE
jgi:hypothetical protein